MSICDGDNEKILKINGISLIFPKSKGHYSSEYYLTEHKFKLDMCILVTNLKFHLRISMYDRDNERTPSLELMEDGMTEGLKGVTLYAPAISWWGIKRNVGVCMCYCFIPTKNIINMELYYMHLILGVGGILFPEFHARLTLHFCQCYFTRMNLEKNCLDFGGPILPLFD